MKIAVSRHVFGSIRGYTTLAKSGDLSPEETAILEVFSFGQTNEPSYLGSLQTEPAYTSRPLHSGRWAVTRVFQGGLDDHNRTTLLFVSAVITIDDWLYSLKCDVNKLLYHPSLWQWNGEEKLEPIEIIVEGRKEAPTLEIRNKVLSLLAAVEKYEREENTTIVVGASDFDAKALRWLNMVLPVTAKQTFSCAARSLNDGLTFSLISMAKEGSFGNSKRRTVNWTPTSTVDNCPYADSLSQFWQPGGEPPWRFIDSCKSFFSIDLAGEPEPEPRERVVRKKPLFSEVKRLKVSYKTRFSRKLAVILFTCVVVACLATVITIGAMRFKVNKEVRSLIEANIKEAKKFLDRNSPGKYFPVDRAAREKAIKEGGRLRYKVAELLERTNDSRLKKINGQLDGWWNLAQNAHRRYGFLGNLVPQFKALKSRTKPNIYPDPNMMSNVADLKQSIAKIDKANLDPKYVSRTEEALHKDIDSWHKAVKKLLVEKEDEVTKITQSALLQTQPENYSEKQYEEYNDFKQKLEGFKEDESLTNAKDSPIKQHQGIVKATIDELNKALESCDMVLGEMNRCRGKAEILLGKATDILNKRNITDGRVENLSRLQEANNYLKEAEKLWPEMAGLSEKKETVESKFRSNFKNFLGEKNNELEKIDAAVTAGELEVYRIDELLKNLRKVKRNSKESDVPEIDKPLQKLNMLVEKAKRLKSDIIAKKENLEKELALAEDCIKQLEKTPRLRSPREKEYKIYTEADKHIKNCFEIQKDNLDATRLDKMLDDWENVNKETVKWGSELYKARKLTKKLGIYPNHLSKIKELENPQEKDYERYKDARRNVDRCLQIKPDTREAKKLREGLDRWKKVNKLTVDLGETLDSCNKYLQKIEDFDASQKEQLLKEKLPEILRKIEKFKEQIGPKSNRMLEDVIEASQELEEKLRLNLNSAQQEGGEIK